MNILFLTSPVEDYLSDSLFHGLRSLLGSSVVDFPKCERMYSSCPGEIRKKIRGGGFTLYSGLCQEMEVDRSEIESKVRLKFFDLVVISDIWRQYTWFATMRQWLTPGRTVLCDGTDSTQIYPASGYWWRYPSRWFVPRSERFLYFKREWTADSARSFSDYCLRRFAKQEIKPSPNWRKIGFSIPAEKIVAEIPTKTKPFPKHIVDAQVRAAVPGSSTTYAFDNEAAYYADLQASRYGITTKRAGWDCLRHYEIAAQGCVICFRDLDQKPTTCAPHGLSEENTIVYEDAAKLFRKIEKLTDNRYQDLQALALAWVKSQTTAIVSQEFLAEVKRALK